MPLLSPTPASATRERSIKDIKIFTSARRCAVSPYFFIRQFLFYIINLIPWLMVMITSFGLDYELHLSHNPNPLLSVNPILSHNSFTVILQPYCRHRHKSRTTQECPRKNYVIVCKLPITSIHQVKLVMEQCP